MMTYVEFQNRDLIYQVGDNATNFYVILNGSVAQSIKNPLIDQWEWAYSNYEALLEWKEKEFDPRAREIL